MRMSRGASVGVVVWAAVWVVAASSGCSGRGAGQVGDGGISSADGGPAFCVPPRQVCGGLCVDPGSDPNHCGTCDRTCATAAPPVTAACRQGHCVQTKRLLGLGTSQSLLTLDTTHLYYFDADTPSESGLARYRLLKAPKSTATPQPLATGLENAPDSLVGDDLDVYWTAAGILHRVPKSGGTATSSSLTGGSFHRLALDETHLYSAWLGADPALLLRIPKPDGTIVFLLRPRLAPWSIAVDAESLYWTDGPAVNKMAKGGDTPSELASGFDSGRVLISSGEDLLLGVHGSGGALWRLPKAGGAALRLADAQGDPLDVAADASRVYWVGAGGLRRVSRGGGEAELLAPQSALQVEVDPTGIYWIARGPEVGSAELLMSVVLW